MKRSRLEPVAVPQPWIVVLSLMLLGAACGGKNSTPETLSRPSASAQRYVSVVCTAVVQWKNSVELSSSSIVMQANSVGDATAYVQGVLDATDQMLRQVRAVGVPTAPNGSNLQSDVIHALVSARSALLRVQADVARILALGPVDLVNEVELPILSTVEAVKSELRNPSRIEMARATASDTGCSRVFRRKAPIGQSA